MAKAKYQTPEYRAARAAIDQAQARDEWLTCVETVCLMETRDIAPTDRADVAHDETGTVILGPAHARCNRSEGATRMHRDRAGMVRWVL
mgnify:CR=1 FL=1